MDYLPVPRNATEDIAVPFLTTFQYDSQGLENFPERHGYAHDGDRAYLNLGPEHLASLLQSWLYFGLLTEYLDDPIDIEDFRSLASQAGSGTVTASLLPGFLQCHEDREHDSVSRKRSRKARKDALRIVRSLEDLVPSVSPVAEVFLSIQLLVWSIHASTSNVQIPKLRSKFLQSRMKDSGWCPYQADQVCRKYNLHVVYYLSRLVRHNPHAISHVPCTLDGCKANNVDEDHYQIRHTKIGCTCDFVRVSTTKVEDIIRTGGIPLISIEAQSHGKNRMKVIEATSRSKYVAISHVWSDGRGNPYENALTQCQVDELESCFLKQPGLKLRTSQLFWMDTLCIPVGDGYDVQDLKLKAINLMAYIYLRAARVFVLESELSLIPLDLSTRTEIYAYILHSAWMKRCWTLQEGALAGNKCYFQMADGAMAPLDYLEPDIDEDFDSALKTDPFMAWRLQAGIDRLSISQALMVLPHVISSLYLKLRPHMLKEINVARKDISKFLHGKSSVVSLQVITGFQERVDKSIKYTLRQECGNALREKWTREFDKTTQGLLKPAYLADEFRNIWNTLRERSTTQADDLQAIFANLLNFNAYQITKLPSRERFNALVASMKVLPLSLLFIDDNQDPLLDLKTDGWIPTSLSSGSLAAGPPMEVREDFLRVEHDMEDWDDDYCLYIVQPSARASNQQMTLDFPDGVSTVTFKRPSPDAEHMNLSVGVGLLVNEKTGTGASVLIMRALTEVDSDGDAHKTQYYADYDCPITTEFTKRTLASRTDDEEAVQATGSDLDIRASNTASNNVRDTPVWFEEDSAHWELLISHNLQKAPKLNSHLYMGSNEGFSLLLAMVLMTFGVVDLPIIIFVIVSRIIIAVRLGWVDLSAIGRASLCLFPVQNLLASVTSAIVPFLVPISEILFIIDRSHHGFQRLEIAYLVCSFISVQLFWLVALATFEYLREQGYKVFLGSFANDSPDLGWFWSFYFRPNFVRKFTAKLKGL